MKNITKKAILSLSMFLLLSKNLQCEEIDKKIVPQFSKFEIKGEEPH